MIREAGYSAYVNQAQCAGSFGVMTFLELVKWIASIKVGVGGFIGHLFSMHVGRLDAVCNISAFVCIE